jgi:hypothetical protein
MKRAHVERDPDGTFTVYSLAPLRVHGLSIEDETEARQMAGRLERDWVRAEPTTIVCSRCGKRLDTATVAKVWADTDFIEHGDHLAAWEPTAANFAEARRAAAAIEKILIDALEEMRR